MRKLDLNNSNFQELNNSEMTMVKGGKHSMDGNHGNEKTPEDYERERKEREAKAAELRRLELEGWMLNRSI